jgi:hypothetical protein
MTAVEPSGGRRPGLASRLAAIHAALCQMRGFAPLVRVAVVLWDEKTDLLSAVAHSGICPPGLDYYDSPLADVPSLALLAAGDEPRIINDTAIYGRHDIRHTHAVRSAGLLSSLTVPIRHRGAFVGFVFYNARIKNFFRPTMVALLRPVTETIAGLVIKER